MDALKAGFAELDYHDDIVFVVEERPTRTVIAWNGTQAPFVRIASRSAHRLQQLAALTVAHSDVETVVIGFHRRGDQI